MGCCRMLEKLDVAAFFFEEQQLPVSACSFSCPILESKPLELPGADIVIQFRGLCWAGDNMSDKWL